MELSIKSENEETYRFNIDGSVKELLLLYSIITENLIENIIETGINEEKAKEVVYFACKEGLNG